jgi:hypothetical protein
MAGTVETDAVGERASSSGGGDGDRLQRAQDAGEPQPDKPDVTPRACAARILCLSTVFTLDVPRRQIGSPPAFGGT